MTVDEVKEAYAMRDILARYGMRANRAGFIECPFHSGDHTASLKIYEKDWHCFGCGRNGDIFTFVELMENLTFKEAFYSLGGTYEKPTFTSRAAVYRAQKAKAQREKEQARIRAKKQMNNLLISVYRDYVDRSEPLSDVWCDSYNALQYQLYIHGNLNDLPY